MNRLELAIAWRYLRSRRGSRLLSFISMIAIGGVVVGVSALIVVMSVMNGLQRDIRDKILLGSPDLRVLTYGDMRIDDWQTVQQQVAGRPGVAAVSPIALTTVVMQSTSNSYREGVQVAGIEPTRPGVADATEIRTRARDGDFSFVTSSGDTTGIVLGRLLADRFLLRLGDTVNIFAAGNTSELNPATGMPNIIITQAEVTGIFDTGLYEYDNNFVYVPLAQAQLFGGLGRAVTSIEVRAVDRDKSELVAADLDSALGPLFRTLDWKEQNRSLFQALTLEKLVMSVILLLIILVAAFNIVSTLTMVVTDKTREIGILKAMGMRAKSIGRIFFLQGVVIGVVGTLLGLLLGLGTAMGVSRCELQVCKLDASVYFIDRIPVAIDPLDVLLVALASMLIAAIATIYPARQAARLYPIEAIRHE